jgi:hypothetical protein
MGWRCCADKRPGSIGGYAKSDKQQSSRAVKHKEAEPPTPEDSFVFLWSRSESARTGKVRETRNVMMRGVELGQMSFVRKRFFGC